MKKITAILCFAFVGLFVCAQEKEEQISAKEVISAMDDILGQTAEEMNAEKNENLKDEINAVLQGVEQTNALNDKINAYKIESLNHRQEVFNWQLKASKWIFVIVMAIVLSGLALSYMHFYKSLKAPAGTESEKTELEMSTSGIKMNSSVIGLIILVLAIAFLYLYLVHVFPINEFNVDTNAVPAT